VLDGCGQSGRASCSADSKPTMLGATLRIRSWARALRTTAQWRARAGVLDWPKVSHGREFGAWSFAPRSRLPPLLRVHSLNRSGVRLENSLPLRPRPGHNLCRPPVKNNRSPHPCGPSRQTPVWRRLHTVRQGRRVPRDHPDLQTSETISEPERYLFPPPTVKEVLGDCPLGNDIDGTSPLQQLKRSTAQGTAPGPLSGSPEGSQWAIVSTTVTS
jgi:hypothetical protein